MREALKQIPVMTFPIPDNIEFANVNPQTGLLAPKGDRGARVEIFIKGAEPLQSPVSPPSVIDFYRMDQSSDDQSL